MTASRRTGGLGQRTCGDLDRCADLVLCDREGLAYLIALKAAKSVTAARLEVNRGEQTWRFSADKARILDGATLPAEAYPTGVGAMGWIRREPLAVVVAITLFNSPLNLTVHKLGPASAAGCPVVCMPADRTPLTALALAELLQEADLPAGWLAILAGEGAGTRAALARHPAIVALSFAGSVPVSWQLARDAAYARVLLELWSAGPLVAEDDAAVEAVAGTIRSRTAAWGGWYHPGGVRSTVRELTVIMRPTSEVWRRSGTRG